MPKLAMSDYEKQTDEYTIKIKEAMARKKMTQRALAVRTGLNQSTISRYLNDIDRCPLYQLRAIAGVLGITIEI